MEESRLTTTARTLKSHLVLIIIIFVVIDLFILSMLTFINRNKTASGIKWQNVTPGQTTSKELESTLGKPLKIQNGSYYYPTTNKNRPAEVVLNQDTVELVKEPVIGNEKGTLQDYINQLGQPEKIFYGENQYAAPGYFWGQKGIMVFGNPNSGVILEIWYFPPINASQFAQSHPELKDKPEYGQF